jgi:hypothetical protein
MIGVVPNDRDGRAGQFGRPAINGPLPAARRLEHWRFRPDRTDPMVLKTHWLLVLAGNFITGLTPLRFVNELTPLRAIPHSGGFSLTGKSCAIRLAAPAYVWAGIFIGPSARASAGRCPVRMTMF